jgi:hypothetical protein
MKAFLSAVVACIVITIAAGYILTSEDPMADSSKTSGSVRLN